MIKTKMLRPEEIKILDAEAGTFTAIVSSESRDRDGDIIRANGWDFSSFAKHPVMLSSHNYYSLRAQIGDWSNLRVAGTEKRPTVIGDGKIMIGRGNEEADWAFELAKEGRLAFSVGFIPDMDKAIPIERDDPFGSKGMEFTKAALLEISAVTIPANSDALQRFVKGVDLSPVIKEIAEEALLDEPKVEVEPVTTAAYDLHDHHYRLDGFGHLPGLVGR